MPVLNDSRKWVKTTIPSITGGEIELWDSLTIGEGEASDGVVGMSRSIFMLTHLIKSWNLTDEQGVVLPINEENVKKLDIMDIDILMNQTSIGKKALQKAEELAEAAREKKTN